MIRTNREVIDLAQARAVDLILADLEPARAALLQIANDPEDRSAPTRYRTEVMRREDAALDTAPSGASYASLRVGPVAVDTDDCRPRLIETLARPDQVPMFRAAARELVARIQDAVQRDRCRSEILARQWDEAGR